MLVLQAQETSAAVPDATAEFACLHNIPPEVLEQAVKLSQQPSQISKTVLTKAEAQRKLAKVSKKKPVPTQENTDKDKYYLCLKQFADMEYCVTTHGRSHEHNRLQTVELAGVEIQIPHDWGPIKV